MNAVKAVQYFIKKAKFIDDIQTAEGIVRAYERNQGETTRTVRKLLKQLDQTNKITELRKFQKVISNEFTNVDIDRNPDPLKVALSGKFMSR